MTYPNKIPQLKIMADNYGVAKISDYVLNNPKFGLWTACVNGKHHYGEGGLQHHTWEVCTLILSSCMYYAQFSGKKDVDLQVAFLSGLFHDVGKLWDYRPVEKLNQPYTTYDEWEGTSHKRDIHHISRSGIEWTKAVAANPEHKNIEDAVLHCILSHHGMREWGSPVFPHSREAWILHHCDSLSARMNDCNKVDLVHSV